MSNPIRIVIVEDDPEMMAVYAENFLMPEFDMTGVTSGEAALKLLRDPEKTFDLLLTDNNMPQMDGMRLLRAIRHEFPRVKLLMLTGYGNWSNSSEAHDVGIYKFVENPVRMKDLKQLIRNIA